MPKLDPRGEAPNPIRAKLAGDISRPIQLVPSLVSRVEDVAAEPEAESRPEPGIELVATTPSAEPLPSTKLAKPKKVLFTVAEQKENDAVLRQLGETIGAGTLGWSHVNRALWSLLRRAQDVIEERRSIAPRLSRPSNGNPIELARFEDTISEYLLALFKDVPRQNLRQPSDFGFLTPMRNRSGEDPLSPCAPLKWVTEPLGTTEK